MKKIITRQELAQCELEFAKKLSSKEKARVRKRIRREYSPLEKIRSLADAARQIAKEDRAFKGPLATEKIQ